MKKFKSIGQFRNIVKDIKDRADFHGVAYPTLDFTGTVKIHGTNAGVGVFGQNVWAQSRSRIITPENDNYDFAKWVEKTKDFWKEVFILNPSDEIVVFGEWAGEGIQKGVAVSKLPRAFYVFNVLVNGEWRPEFLPETNLDVGIVNLPNIWTKSITIDFNHPDQSQNILQEMTEEVEKECPVGKHFGVSGIGEGIVWSSFDYEFLFKVKGEKHSVSKVKTLAKIDPERLASIKEFVDYAATPNRIDQGISETMPTGPDIRQLGALMKWVNQDILKEESDTLEASGLTMKDVGKEISARVRSHFLEKPI